MGEYVGPAGFNSILRDLTRRVAALENGVRASRTTVRNGLLIIADDLGRTTLAVGKQPDGKVALRVFDPVTGAVQVSLGNLADGTYGLEQINSTGQTVSLAAIALAARTATVAPRVYSNSAAWVDLGGPEVTVKVPSAGRVEALLTAEMGVPTDGGYAKIGVSVDGGATIRVAACYSADAAIFPGAGGEVIEGLAAGDHTFKMMYEVGIASLTGESHWSERTISVRPY